MYCPVARQIVALLAASLLASSPLAAQGERQTPQTSFGTRTVADALLKLQDLIDQPTPDELARPDLDAYRVQTEWLRRVVARLKSPRDMATGQASGKRQHAPVTVKTELDAMRKAIEAESTKFALQSNVLKARHEAAMAAIRNMK